MTAGDDARGAVSAAADLAAIVVVGIGADGWAGLGEAARHAIAHAERVVGSARQLDLLPATVSAERVAWPSPMEPLVDELAANGGAVVLASGDPLLHGVGATLIRKAGPGRVAVLPHVSAFALACARMGWSQVDVELVSTVARPPEVLIRALQPARRIVAFTTDAAALAEVLSARGFGGSPFTVLEQLGGPRERRIDTTARQAVELELDPLHAVAIEVAGPGLPRTPGLPDAAFATDGQLTKRHVRAITVAALAPAPGELLWDVGAGSGSIAIEWLRAERTRAIAIESREDRAAHIEANALNLGVPELKVIRARAPETLAGLPTPDAIFIGGGITTPGLLDACWDALPSGGRIVANTVTLEGERLVTGRGGTLTRIDVAHAEPIGGFTGWRAQMTVVQWAAVKP